METKEKINIICNNLKDVLLYKNTKYGDSALKPLNVFSKLDATNSICIRLDDKLSRIKNSNELKMNDIVDIMGYLVLLCADKEYLNFDKLKD